MKKINSALWLLLDSQHSGGIETHVLELADGLKQHNINVQVVFLNNYGVHPLRSALQHRHIDTISLDGSLRSLWNELRKQSPALIHTHGYKAGIIGRIICKLTNKAVVSTFHSGEKGNIKMRLYRWIDHMTAHFSPCICVSEEIKKSAKLKAEVIENFVGSNHHHDSKD